MSVVIYFKVMVRSAVRVAQAMHSSNVFVHCSCFLHVAMHTWCEVSNGRPSREKLLQKLFIRLLLSSGNIVKQ